MSWPVDKLEDRYQTIAPTDADIIEGKSRCTFICPAHQSSIDSLTLPFSNIAKKHLPEMKRRTEGFADPFKTFVMKMKPDAPVSISFILFFTNRSS